MNYVSLRYNIHDLQNPGIVHLNGNMLKSSTKLAVLRQTRSANPSTAQFCNYSPRVCMRTRLDGYEFCVRHILEDKNSPYKQCTYVSGKTNRRCTAAAPRLEKRDGFCPEHARKTALSRNRMMVKSRRPKNLHTLLDDLSYHVVKPQSDSEVRQKGVAKAGSHVMDYASESDSDHEGMKVQEIWKTDEETDMESLDSEQEDPLKHAGVYTAEEVASILRDKLIRLQSLYIDQFRFLHHMLREKRRKYLHGLSQLEGSTIPAVEELLTTNLSERAAHHKLYALQRYQKCFGKEALLHRQCKERRIAFSEGANYKAPAFPECIALKDDGTKCKAHTVPLAKHCIDHIASDSRQVLFKQCDHGSVCHRCVVAIDDTMTCDLHRQLQPLVYRFSKKQEEVEMKDEPVDVVGISDLHSDLCHDLSFDLSGQSLLGETNSSVDANTASQRTA